MSPSCSSVLPAILCLKSLYVGYQQYPSIGSPRGPGVQAHKDKPYETASPTGLTVSWTLIPVTEWKRASRTSLAMLILDRATIRLS